jgi:glycine cleavage system aminomethyltransferase T
MAAPKRTIVTLEWNDDDVLDVFASHFRPGPEFKIFEFPVTPHHMGIIGHADHVVKGGRDVGIASGVAYSYHFRKILSHCTIDIDQAEIGNEVIVRWGDHGGAIKDIRAQVAQYPYLTENRNQVVVV